MEAVLKLAKLQGSIVAQAFLPVLRMFRVFRMFSVFCVFSQAGIPIAIGSAT